MGPFALPTNRFFSLGCMLFVATCKDKETLPIREPPVTSPSGVASVLRVDAAAFELSVDPSAPAGDLKADVAAFTTIEACVQKRAQLDPLVADALESIGYETFLFDACRTLDAVKAKDAKRCMPIESSFLQRRCERDVAIVSGDENACPFEIPTRHEYGREPLCIAVASRAPALCAGVSFIDRAKCDALASGSAMACGRVPFAGPRARCQREAARWGAILEGPRKTLTIGAPKGKLRVTAIDGSASAGEPESDLSSSLSRGLVVRESGDQTRITLGSFRESGTSAFAPSPTANTTFNAELVIGPKSAELKRGELAIPNSVTLAVPGAPSALRVVVTKLERARGGEVQIAVEGEIGATPRKYRLRVDVTTFVRDYVNDSEGAGSPPSGAASSR